MVPLGMSDVLTYCTRKRTGFQTSRGYNISILNTQPNTTETPSQFTVSSFTRLATHHVQHRFAKFGRPYKSTFVCAAYP